MEKTILLILFIAATNLYLTGQTWQQAAGIPQNEYIYDLASYNNYVFAATMTGIYRSDDNGKTFEPKNNGIINTSGLGAHAFSIAGNKIYVANIYGIFVTEDFGENWVDLNLPEHTYSLSVFADDSIILAGVPGGGLYRSADFGSTWNGVTADHIYKIVKVGNYYFAGSWSDVVYSDDYGITWQSSDFNRFTFWTFSMNDTIFVCPTDGGIEKTSPENIDWQSVDGISSVVNGIVFKSDTVFAVTNEKVMYSKYSDMNAPWSELPLDGLPLFNSNILWSSAISGDYILAGTSGTDGTSGLGVWCLNLKEAFNSVAELTTKDHRNMYPNPANCSIFVSGVKDGSTVQIFNITGKRESSEVVKNNQLNISGLKPGIYIIKIWDRKRLFIGKFSKQ